MNSAKALPRTKLVITSVGSLVGAALLECIEQVGRERFELIGMNSKSSAVNNFRCDAVYLSPPVRDRCAWRDLLDRIVREHHPALIIPGRDDDVVALAEWKRDGGDCVAMVGSVAMAEMIRDKWKSYCFAREHGLPFAESAIDAAGVARLATTAGLPLIAKPRLGYGSNGVRFLFTPEHIERAFEIEDTIVQEALSPAETMDPAKLAYGVPLWFAPVQVGSPVATTVLDDNGVDVLGLSYADHVRGAAVSNHLIDDADYRSSSERFARTAWEQGWRGMFCIQARPNRDGKLIPVELAGRFLGGTSAMATLGVNVFERLLSIFIPHYPAPLPIAPNYDLRVTKQVRSLLHRRSDELALEAQGLWVRR